jgi:cell division protein FtsB
MKILALSLLAVVLLLQYRLWISDGGMREVWRLRREVATQQDLNAQLKDRNRTLTAEVLDLKKGKSAIEERARTDLGMVGSNETFFQVAPKVAATGKPAIDALKLASQK